MNSSSRTMHRLSRFGLPLAMLLAGTTGAQEAPAPSPAHAYPGDRIGVPALSGGCPPLQIDPARSPTVRLTRVYDTPGFPVPPPYSSSTTVHEYALDYWLVRDDNVPCPLPPPLDYDTLIDVGDLPVGLHQFTVRAFIGDELFESYSTETWVGGSLKPGADISGAWYAPEQAGRGAFVIAAGSTLAVYWAIHDAAGLPSWVVMSVPFDEGNAWQGTAFNTDGAPLAPGAADLQVREWGQLELRYIGCGRARITWDAIEPGTTDGELELAQLMLPDGVEPCDITGRTGAQAVWVE